MSIQTSKKCIKNATTNSKKTLDIQHSNKVNQIQELTNRKQELTSELSSITKEIERLTQVRKTIGLTDDEFDTLISLTDKKEEHQRDIESINEQINEVDYYVDTASILFKYYDIVEKGAGEDENINNVDVRDNSILRFFIKTDDERNKEKPEDNRASLLDKYLSLTDENYLKMSQLEAKDCCNYCGSSNMSMLINDGLNLCQDCCSVEHVTLDHDKPSYKESYPSEIHYFAYKRINHLNESIKFMVLSVFYRLCKNYLRQEKTQKVHTHKTV